MGHLLILTTAALTTPTGTITTHSNENTDNKIMITAMIHGSGDDENNNNRYVKIMAKPSSWH